MQPVYCDGFNGMEAFEGLPVRSRECHVAANVSGRASRFEAAQDIAFCQLLVFDAHDCVCEDSSLP
jgi:hypothetical protein